VDGGRLLESDDTAGHHAAPQWYEDTHPRPREPLPRSWQSVRQQLRDWPQRRDIDEVGGLRVLQ
jgi:hypothetical protein